MGIGEGNTDMPLLSELEGNGLTFALGSSGCDRSWSSDSLGQELRLPGAGPILLAFSLGFLKVPGRERRAGYRAGRRRAVRRLCDIFLLLF